MSEHSESECDLDLSYESSIFEKDRIDDKTENILVILPYQFEPVLEENHEDDDGQNKAESQDDGRLLTTDWLVQY